MKKLVIYNQLFNSFLQETILRPEEPLQYVWTKDFENAGRFNSEDADYIELINNLPSECIILSIVKK